MRAVAVQGFKASPETVDIPKPSPGAGEILVRIAAAGVNPVDSTIASGLMGPAVPARFPLILGLDFSGRVEALGAGAARFAVGDAVFGQTFPGGAYAEYLVVREDSPVAHAPGSIELKTAAAVPTAGMTAMDILNRASVREDESMMIVGAAGGVGTFLTQLASARDVRVVAVTRGDESVRMGSFGAAVTIDASAESVADRMSRDEYPEGVDVLVDLVSGDPEAFKANAALVHDGGVALTTRGASPADGSAKAGVEDIDFVLKASCELLTALADEIDSGRLRVSVESEVSLDEAALVVARNATGGARGKTIIVP